MIDYRIISTGSKGNCVIINSIIAIDMGVPFQALKDIYKDLQLVLLTHIHGDHFNRRTIKKLAQERPTLRWGIPDWLACDMLDLVEPKQIDVYDCETVSMYDRDFPVEIGAFPLPHNVPNCGYSVYFADSGESMFYATDTNSMDGIEAKNYDLYMLEANYSEAEITERIRQKQANGEYCHEWDVLHNHLSKEKADNWLYQNMGPNSRYIYLHQHDNQQQ